MQNDRHRLEPTAASSQMKTHEHRTYLAVETGSIEIN